MASMNEELRSLYSQLCRKADLDATVKALEQKRSVLAPEVKRLARVAKAEQRDVRRLERPSVAALVYHVAGTLDERLDTERSEAADAQMRHAASARELEDIESRLQDAAARLAATESGRERYGELLAQKQAAIKAAGGPDADKIEGKERTLAFLDSQLRGVRDALAAGKAAWNAVQSVLSGLDTAACHTALSRGRGLVNDLTSMSDSLPHAQSAIYSLQKHLTEFENKLGMTPVR